MTTFAPVLVLDGEQRSALAVTRSLGRKGIPVTVGSNSPIAITAKSRYASRFHLLPDMHSSPNLTLQEINACCRANDIGVIVPTTDSSTMLLHKADIPGVTIAAPPMAAYEAVTDKFQLYQTAQKLGVPCPTTALASTADELQYLLRTWDGPVVIKPTRSKFLVNNTIQATSVIVAKSSNEALKSVQSKPWYGHIPCMLQEFVEGSGAGLFALYDNGKPIAQFAHRRIREKPPTGGVSVCSESVAINPEIADYSTRLLTASDWHGPAMVEFRVTPDGTPFLMEINGRFWGSLQLGIDCGVDFPWLLYQISIGRHVTPVDSFAVGQRLRWLLGDLDHLILSLRDSQLPISRKLFKVAQFINPIQPRTHLEVLRISDLLPFLRECGNWLRHAIQ